jgi:hypothetical protein
MMIYNKISMMLVMLLFSFNVMAAVYHTGIQNGVNPRGPVQRTVGTPVVHPYTHVNHRYHRNLNNRNYGPNHVRAAPVYRR